MAGKKKSSANAGSNPLGKGSVMSRRQFIRKAGLAGGAIAAAGLGLSGNAKAQSSQPASQSPVTPNPDPAHIDDSDPTNILVAPVEDTSMKYERKTVFQWQEVLFGKNYRQDPRISVADAASFDPETSSVRPLSETNPGTPENPTEWDPRRRTLDAMNIEWAANNVRKNADGSPGTVMLRHIPGLPFEFGSDFDLNSDFPPGFGVFLCNDCNITGEVDADGEPLTKINNGSACFVANWWLAFVAFGNVGVQLWHDFVGRFTFKNIILEDSTYPSLLSYSGFDISSWTPHVLENTEVDNVRVINAKPSAPGGDTNLVMLFENDYGKVAVRNCHISAVNTFIPEDPNSGWHFMAGIAVTNSMTGPPFQPPAGPYLIAENNVLDIASSHLGSIGIIINSGEGAEVRNNHIKADIAICSEEVGWNGGGAVTIEDNTECTARVAGFSCVNAAGSQIEIYNPDYDPSLPPGPDNPEMVTYQHPGIVLTIRRNTMNMDSSGSIELIYGFSSGMIAQDAFFMGYPSDCLKNATVQGNSFTGSADFGVFMGDFWGIPDTASGNRFLGNDFASLSSGIAAVYLGATTSGNVFGPNKYPPGGATKCVSDDGENNRIVGLPANTVTNPGIGKAIKDLVSRSKSAKGKLSGKIPKNPWGFGPPKKRS